MEGSVFSSACQVQKQRDFNPPDSSNSSQLLSSFSVSSLLNGCLTSQIFGDVLNGLGIFSIASQKPQTKVEEKSAISFAAGSAFLH